MNITKWLRISEIRNSKIENQIQLLTHIQTSTKGISEMEEISIKCENALILRDGKYQIIMQNTLYYVNNHDNN